MGDDIPEGYDVYKLKLLTNVMLALERVVRDDDSLYESVDDWVLEAIREKYYVRP